MAHAIAQGLKGGADITIRINCAYPEADVPAAVLSGVVQINFPKAETAEQMRNLDRLITRQSAFRASGPAPSVSVRTSRRRSGSRTRMRLPPPARVSIPSLAVRATICPWTWASRCSSGSTSLCNRGEGALVAKALGLEYTGGVYLPDTTSGNVGDRELTRQRAEANRRAGLRAGGGLHPNTVEPQNVGLTPTPEEVQEAQRILAYFAQLDEQGEVEGELDGRVVDKYAGRACRSCSSGRRYARKDAHKARAQARARRWKPRSVPGVRLASATER